jgi:hypothetical protein
MAICELCDLEMSTASSCTVTALHLGDLTAAVLPYGREPGWRATRGRCHDCGVARRGFHHVGCDMQRCPGCGGQLISCGCVWEELGNDLDGDDDEGGGDGEELLLVAGQLTASGLDDAASLGRPTTQAS